ncbi:MAG: tRNA (N6-threonylcarbamoyladenosine(37)-N6)-methyltransferase TrmO [Desulfobacterales bacterium]
MDECIISPVGIVTKTSGTTEIEIFDAYGDALLGLDGFSHINVLYWFHENDTPAKRAMLQVHPRKDPKNPLTGVFATHSPMRPNPIALTLCRILAIEEHRIRIDKIDARDGSPVIDIKCHIPDTGTEPNVRVPGWV